MEIEPDVPVSVIEATETDDDAQALMDVRRFILPANPAGDLCEEELGPVGVAYCYCGGFGRCGRCGCGCGRWGCYAKTRPTVILFPRGAPGGAGPGRRK